jgi:hypothetical protein
LSERTVEVADPPEPELRTDLVGGEDPLPLAVSAALIGEYRWIETALYRLIGGWVTDTPIAAVKVHLDAQSMRHSWHAELWGERLPVMAGSDPDELTRPSPPTAALFAVLSGTRPPSDEPGSSWPPAADVLIERPGVLPRLAGLYRVVLPRLVVTYQRHLRAAAPVTDGPVLRALGLVLNDEYEDWHAGERMVQRLVSRPHDVAAVYGFLEQLESVVVGAGASSGLVTVPGD